MSAFTMLLGGITVLPAERGGGGGVKEWTIQFTTLGSVPLHFTNRIPCERYEHGKHSKSQLNITCEKVNASQFVRSDPG